GADRPAAEPIDSAAESPGKKRSAAHSCHSRGRSAAATGCTISHNDQGRWLTPVARTSRARFAYAGPVGARGWSDQRLKNANVPGALPESQPTRRYSGSSSALIVSASARL